MQEIALIAGAAIVLAAILTVAVMRRPAANWRKVARTHEPYSNLKDEEVETVDSRDDFIGAVKTSLERHYLSKPITRAAVEGQYTRNELYQKLTEDVKRSAGDILIPGEIKEVVEKAYEDVTSVWTKEKKKAQG